MYDLQSVAGALSADLKGPNAYWRKASIDTRTMERGDLFFALKGEVTDGHKFMAEALVQAGYPVIDESNASKLRLTEAQSALVVTDVFSSLTQLGHYCRDHFEGQVLAITGSYGKTSVKEMVGAIVSAHYGNVVMTVGNQNNHLGVPLTLSVMRDQKVAVLEVGMNQRGEILKLGSQIKPHIALITAIGKAHLGNFANEAEVAQEKGSLFTALPTTGTAILPADSAYRSVLKKIAKGRKVLTFGTADDADCRVLNSGIDEFGRCQTNLEIGGLGGEEISLNLQLVGRHVALNAAAAVLMGIELGVPLAVAKDALESQPPLTGRLQPIRLESGALLIDDSYNASLDTVLSAIDLLSAYRGKRIFVLGDLTELGVFTDAIHDKIGRALADSDIDVCMATGAATQRAMNATYAGHHYATMTELYAAVMAEITSDSVVLVKGSRASRMDELVKRLSQRNDSKLDVRA